MSVRKGDHGVHSLMHPYFGDVFEVQLQFSLTNRWLSLSLRRLVSKTRLLRHSCTPSCYQEHPTRTSYIASRHVKNNG